MARAVRSLYALLAAGLTASLPFAVLAASAARIVRVSYLQGAALVEHDPQHKDIHYVAVNTPITSGLWVYTPAGTRFEAEFEGGNTLRVADDSAFAFENLVLGDSGGKQNTILIHHGTVYLNFDKMRQDDELTVHVRGQEFVARKPVRLRVLSNEAGIRVSVFHGGVTRMGEHPQEIGKKETLEMRVGTVSDPRVVDGIEMLASDKWDREREDLRAIQRSPDSGRVLLLYPSHEPLPLRNGPPR